MTSPHRPATADGLREHHLVDDEGQQIGVAATGMPIPVQSQ